MNVGEKKVSKDSGNTIEKTGNTTYKVTTPEYEEFQKMKQKFNKVHSAYENPKNQRTKDKKLLTEKSTKVASKVKEHIPGSGTTYHQMVKDLEKVKREHGIHSRRK